MCGRYTLSTPGEEIAEVFGLSESLEVEPRFNIAPTQMAPIVRAVGEGRQASLCRWGLIPYWADDPSIGSRMINARSETAAQKPAYRDAFRERRCLVPADGFFEWRKSGPHRQPYFFSAPTGDLFAVAGLWDRWRRNGEEIESYTLLTTDANGIVSEVHDRMPVILPAGRWSEWLDPSADPEGLSNLLEPLADSALTAHPVSTLVNSPANDSSRCIEAIAPEEVLEERQQSLF